MLQTVEAGAAGAGAGAGERQQLEQLLEGISSQIRQQADLMRTVKTSDFRETNNLV
jgi:hypothetical protein